MRLRKSHPNTTTCKIVNTVHTASHIMYSCYMLHLLLLSTYCCSAQAPNTVDYLPLGALGAAVEADAKRMTIALPQGFKPEAPPHQPMLLPFATPAPSSPSGGWRPIVGDAVTPPHSIIMTPPTPLVPPPLAVLQDRIDLGSREENIVQQDGPLLESIVYGTWKPPERPLSPDEIQKPTAPPVAATTAMYSRKRPAASLERLGVEHPIAGIQTAGASPLNQKYERKRISTTTRAQHLSAVSPPTKYYIHFNMSDLNILEMVKQINDSIDETSAHLHTLKKHTWKHQETSESSLENESENENENEVKSESEAESETEMPTADVSKVWPTDFIASLERQKLAQQNVSYSFNGDSSDPPQALNGLNIPSSLMPAFNITRVGVPYEKQSPAEEPALCVPLTVLEQAGEGEVMEVERVYCFPLPPSHKDTSVRDGTKAKVENYTDYEGINATDRLNLSYYIQILSLILNAKRKLQ
ncbi:uncharacterized protein LOC118743851 [Rhagoletis pomonella]|uniref:uncharacterized protein LOC118743851 n=1 Tax=Rhagoletis pomonella TaxID=28610 RepID=UPI001784908B|nr:uncharacterized protein LOC118743851 [Rhagoletis pomonella]